MVDVSGVSIVRAVGPVHTYCPDTKLHADQRGVASELKSNIDVTKLSEEGLNF